MCFVPQPVSTTAGFLNLAERDLQSSGHLLGHLYPDSKSFHLGAVPFLTALLFQYLQVF